MQHFYLHYSDRGANGCLLVSDGDRQYFRSRKDALAFAIQQCYEQRAPEGEPIINIEGSDGQWRSFDCRLLPFNGLTSGLERKH